MRLHLSLSRKSSLLGFGLAGGLLAAAGIALSAGSPPPTGAAPTAAYSITGTTEPLQPGVTTHLTLTVSNPQTTRLYLTSVAAAVDSAVLPNGSPAPAACAGYLDPSLPHPWTSWDGPTSVAPASDDSHPGTATLVVALSFADTDTNQDACQGVTYNFRYTGSAYYTDPTSTGLVTSPNPANAGAPVTMKATVTSTYSGASPTGTVTFSSPSGPIADSPVPLVAVGGTNTSTASLSTSSLPAGSTQITATYNPSGVSNRGPDFAGSSADARETVFAGGVTGPTSTATTVVGPGQTYKGSLRITS